MQELRYDLERDAVRVVLTDAADTEYDEEVSQVMIHGGIYLASADTFKLCDGCTQVLDLIWAGNEQENACPASTSTDSAA